MQQIRRMALLCAVCAVAPAQMREAGDWQEYNGEGASALRQQRFYAAIVSLQTAERFDHSGNVVAKELAIAYSSLHPITPPGKAIWGYRAPGACQVSANEHL